MEIKQMTQCRSWRSPACEGGKGDVLAGYRAAIHQKLVHRQPNGAPATKAMRPRVQALARTERDNLARVHFDPRPNRPRSAADRQGDRECIVRNHDERTSWQLLFGGQQGYSG